ncbi:hypothetical protein I601_1410 [Nocardioides dokdonensis FR1436]|uniref:LuxR family transcriptional regulator n=1 Tax=Nocardioides dokdonensis FR1436 TaxID=1300347 RepID=A0A1A9GHR6_9ACTN|nr:LuxR family transcriptional regulator [Nocardioides dokdonensis]ANH37847.1 hypothetical protein I601_1410 [Nocardioides dokdonensis FR1436]
MSRYGPEHRALFESGAAPLYEAAVAEGGLGVDDARVQDGADTHAAFALLLELGLLHLDPEGATYLPEDPSTVQSRVVSPLSQSGSRLLEESSQWARAFGGLAQTWRRAPQNERGGPFTYLRDGAISSYLEALVAEVEDEMLTAQPQAGRDAATLAAAAQRDIAALERGVRIRTLYQHSARRSTITHQYVASVTERGAEVRTLDEFFNRMIVVDRRVAIIPAAEDLTVAIAVREPSVVAYLVDVFERAWGRGRAFTNKDTSLLRDIAVEQRQMTIRMLVEGHADPVSAKRLGVSPRTYAGYVADLKDEYEAETRFQLGYTMGRLGISGTETPDSPGASGPLGAPAGPGSPEGA